MGQIGVEHEVYRVPRPIVAPRIVPQKKPVEAPVPMEPIKAPVKVER